MKNAHAPALPMLAAFSAAAGVELTDLLHPLHEVGELLELRPLVVGVADGHVDVDGLLDGFHGIAPPFLSPRT